MILFTSFPKAGRTWLRVLLWRISDNFSKESTGCTFSSLDEHPRISGDYNLPSLKFAHEIPGKRKYRKTIVLIRDPCDMIISYYFFKMSKKSKLFGFNRFVKTYIPKLIRFYKKWDFIIRECDKYLIVKYEDIHKNAKETILSVCCFIGLEASDKNIDDAILYASFDNMKELEKKRVLDPEYSHSQIKIRNGKIGTYKKYLNKKQLKIINNCIKKCKLLSKNYGV